MDKATERNVLKTVFISLLTDLLGFTVILPLFPSLLEFYEANDKSLLYQSIKRSLKWFRGVIGVPEAENIDSVLFGGMIGSLFSFLQFLNSPLFGAFSDVYGRKVMIITSLLGSSISYAVWSISNSFSLFLIARIIGGLSEANVSISTAVVADLPSIKSRTQGMAVIGVAFSFGFIFGPMIGAYFTYLSKDEENFFFAPAIFSLLITLFDVFYVKYFLIETLPPNKRAKSVAKSFSDLLHLLNPVSLFKFSSVSTSNSKQDCSLRQLGLVYFLYLFIFSGLEFTLSFVAHKRFGFTRMQQGQMFALLGITMAVVQGGYIRKKMAGKEKSLATRGISMLIPGFFIIGLSSHLVPFCFGLLLFAYAASSVVPCISAMASNFGLQSQKGKLMGIFRSLGALARATGPISMSATYWLYGASTTYVIGGLLLLIPLLLLINARIGKKEEKKSVE